MQILFRLANNKKKDVFRDTQAVAEFRLLHRSLCLNTKTSVAVLVFLVLLFFPIHTTSAYKSAQRVSSPYSMPPLAMQVSQRILSRVSKPTVFFKPTRGVSKQTTMTGPVSARSSEWTNSADQKFHRNRYELCNGSISPSEPSRLSDALIATAMRGGGNGTMCPGAFSRSLATQQKHTFKTQCISPSRKAVCSVKTETGSGAQLTRKNVATTTDRCKADQVLFNVTDILDSRGTQESRQLLVQWEKGDTTWEPYDVINEDVPTMVKRYEQRMEERRAVHNTPERWEATVVEPDGETKVVSRFFHGKRRDQRGTSYSIKPFSLKLEKNPVGVLKRGTWNIDFCDIIDTIDDIYKREGKGCTEQAYQQAILFDLYRRGIPAIAERPLYSRNESFSILKGRVDLEIQSRFVLELKIHEPSDRNIARDRLQLERYLFCYRQNRQYLQQAALVYLYGDEVSIIDVPTFRL